MTVNIEEPIEGKVLEALPAIYTELKITTAPAEVLDQARQAARALTDVIKNKANPVRFRGETYLEFEDWQTVGRFYNVTAKVVDVQPIEVGESHGFRATADAMRDGVAISSAVAMCLNDEANWRGKPMAQLMSMAQTRASAKALRNVLAWVVVLAGYKPTPAEEMPRDDDGGARLRNPTGDEVTRYRNEVAAKADPMTATERAEIDTAFRKLEDGSTQRAAVVETLKSWGYKTWGAFLTNGTQKQAANIVLLIGASE